MEANAKIREIIDDIEYEESYAKKNADMHDQYYKGYVDALDYVKERIVRSKLEKGA